MHELFKAGDNFVVSPRDAVECLRILREVGLSELTAKLSTAYVQGIRGLFESVSGGLFEEPDHLQHSLESVGAILGVGAVERSDMLQRYECIVFFSAQIRLIAAMGDDQVTVWDEESPPLVVSSKLSLPYSGSDSEIFAEEWLSLSSREAHYSDAEDAWSDLIGAVDAVPGANDLSERLGELDIYDGAEVVMPFGAFRLGPNEYRDGGWEFTALVGGATIILTCWYDDSTYVGGSREGMYMEPPWVVTSEPSSELPSLPAMWLLNSVLIGACSPA
jgi:hypothetical protein